jgi:hypothetical protein
MHGFTATAFTPKGSILLKLKFKVLLFTLVFAALANAQAHSNALSWAWSQGIGDPATGFHVWKAATCAALVTTGTPYATVIPSSTLGYTDNAVTAGQSNCYEVTSYNAGGDSAPSNQLNATTPVSAPNAPTGLTGTAKLKKPLKVKAK